MNGRKRSPEYIAKVVSSYRKAIDAYYDKTLNNQLKENLVEELKKVYNRGFSNGFYLGLPTSNDFATIYGSAATTKKEYLGKVSNFYKKSNIALLHIEAGILLVGDDIYISGQTTGIVELKIKSLMIDDIEVNEAKQGDRPTIVCNHPIRERDLVYKIVQK